ncbi:MAG: hypothetical protein GEU98_27355 [Pseudonocardiaceae bacterium]|nr:hypothetical protein [Pseudonocardiaceae bacterium]
MPDVMPTPQRPWVPPQHRESADKMFASPAELAGRSWEQVRQRLASEHTYWLVTASTDGFPHPRPVWGTWWDGTMVFGLGNGNRTARDLAANPRAAIHLQSGEEVVIVEGVAGQIDGMPVGDLWMGKYGVPPPEVDWSTFALRPHKVLTWAFKDLPRSITSWRFG